MKVGQAQIMPKELIPESENPESRNESVPLTRERRKSDKTEGSIMWKGQGVYHDGEAFGEGLNHVFINKEFQKLSCYRQFATGAGNCKVNLIKE